MSGGPHRTRRRLLAGMGAAGLAVAVGATFLVSKLARKPPADPPMRVYSCDDLFRGVRAAGPHETLGPKNAFLLPGSRGLCQVSMWSNADGCHLQRGDCCRDEGQHTVEYFIDAPAQLIPCGKVVDLGVRVATCVCGPPITDGGSIEARKAWLKLDLPPAGTRQGQDHLKGSVR